MTVSTVASARPPATDLSLDETLRIMDVARALRRERDVAAEQFNRDEVRARLRERLMASTEITGDRFTPAEVEAAIDQYFNNLHTYRDPPWSMSLLFAHLYIRRKRVLVALILCAVLIWWIF